MVRLLTSCLAIAALALAACGSAAPAVTTPAPMTYDGLVAALRAAGAQVEEEPLDTAQPFFDERGRVLRLNGAELVIFTFPDAPAAATAAGRVSLDGHTADLPGRGLHVDWIAPPHFYRRDAIIVQYIGDRGDITTLLTQLLGPQFAGR